MTIKLDRYRCMGNLSLNEGHATVSKWGEYCQDCTGRVLKMARYVREHPETWPKDRERKP